jgi:hypothetical protein
MGSQSLWQLIDIDDSMHFELLWTGTGWVDVPGEFVEQQLINRTLGFEEWGREGNQETETSIRTYFPEALEPRFTPEQQAQINKMLELRVEDRPKRIAELVHQAQVDKAGQPYIGHPSRVVTNTSLYMMKQWSPFTEEQDFADAFAAAWLHDVLEDSGDEAWPVVFPSDLVEWGVTAQALGIIELCTREASYARFLGRPHDEASYYEEINKVPLARLVKLADMADNCNKSRNELLVSQGKKDRSDKYFKAMDDYFNVTDEEVFWLSDRIEDSLEGWDEVPSK